MSRLRPITPQHYTVPSFSMKLFKPVRRQIISQQSTINEIFDYLFESSRPAAVTVRSISAQPLSTSKSKKQSNVYLRPKVTYNPMIVKQNSPMIVVVGRPVGQKPQTFQRKKLCVRSNAEALRIPNQTPPKQFRKFTPQVTKLKRPQSANVSKPKPQQRAVLDDIMVVVGLDNDSMHAK